MRIVVAAVLVALNVGGALAATSAREILEERKHLYETKYSWSDQHQVVRVRTVARNGRQQVRVLEVYERLYSDGDRRALLVFLEPDTVKGTAVLSQLHEHRVAERWLYLPKFRRARRFAGKMSDEGVVGTDLTHQEMDLMQAMLKWTESDARVALRADEVIEGTQVHVLELTPWNHQGEYEQFMLWVGRRDLVMRQLEFYGPGATLTKRVRQSGIRFVGTVPVASHVEVENPRSGTRSAFDVLEAAFNVGFEDGVFSLPRLESWGH